MLDKILAYKTTVFLTLMQSVEWTVLEHNFTSVVFTCLAPGGAQLTQVCCKFTFKPEENRNYDMKKFIVTAVHVTI